MAASCALRPDQTGDRCSGEHLPQGERHFAFRQGSCKRAPTTAPRGLCSQPLLHGMPGAQLAGMADPGSGWLQRPLGPVVRAFCASPVGTCPDCRSYQKRIRRAPDLTRLEFGASHLGPHSGAVAQLSRCRRSIASGYKLKGGGKLSLMLAAKAAKLFALYA